MGGLFSCHIVIEICRRAALKCVCEHAQSVHTVPLAANHWDPKPQERDGLHAKLSPSGFSSWFVYGVQWELLLLLSFSLIRCVL